MTRDEILERLAKQKAAGVFFAGERVDPLIETYYTKYEPSVRLRFKRRGRAQAELERNKLTQIG
jgi:hypothetical protein